MLERISVNPKVCGGEPCIKGTRIPIYIILDLLKEGYSFERIIHDCYPQLSREDIQAVLEYSSVLIRDEEFIFLPKEGEEYEISHG